MRARQWVKEGRAGMSGREGSGAGGQSETDRSLQRAAIKLGKYHYQIFNKVAALRR